MTYLNLKDLDSSKIYIEKGIRESLPYNDDPSYYPDFVYTSGILEYFKGNYKSSIDSLDKSVLYLNDYNMAFAHYFIKKSYEKINKPTKAYEACFKIDSIADKNEYSFPELREVYEDLIDYYGDSNNTKSQLLYLNKILKLDSLLDKKNTMSSDIIIKYDTPRLISEKERLIKELKSESSISKKAIVFLVVILLIVSGLFFYKQKRNKQKLEQLLNRPTTKDTTPSKIVASTEGIDDTIITTIKKKLTHFETQHQFLDANTTLNSLAKKMDTNTKYLSSTINAYKQKNFSNYINDLRVDYAIEKLKNDSKFRNYTIKAIATEIGFNNAASFSTAFYKNTGIKPSYFIKSLISK